MANKTIGPFMIKEIIRLKIEGYSHKKISKILDKSRPVIIKYAKQIDTSGFSLQELYGMSEWEIHEIFEVNSTPKSNSENIINTQLTSFFSYAEKELRRTGVTKKLLWEEYKETHPEGVMYSQFCHHFLKYLSNSEGYMPIEHKAGDKLFVDHTGKKLKVVDPETGEVHEKEVFVATLGASQYTYVEACESQKLPDYLMVLENALRYFGGVPKCIVPDNLKSAVTKACKYEPQLNRHLADFAAHYNTTIVPARSRKPKDKSLVEGAVNIVYNRIYARIRNDVFYTIDDLNKAILDKLDYYNDVPFQGKEHNRKELFLEIDKPELKPLQTIPYELKEYKTSRVQKNSHIYLSGDKNYYSVHHTYIGKQVNVVISNKTVEIYYKYQRIAFHQRCRVPNKYTTVNEHMPSTHRFVAEWCPEKFIKWAKNIGTHTQQYIESILNTYTYPEQAYKSCLGILSMTKKVGEERLENACRRALNFNVYNYKTIKNILENGLDNPDYNSESRIHIPKHENIRGKEYYQ